MNTELTAPTVYKIPSHRLSVFTERFTALQRRARKLGCELPEAEVGEPIEVTTTHTDPDDGEVFVTCRMFYPVTVAGVAPRLGGWEFISVVDFETSPAVFRKLPSAGDADLPDRFRSLGPVCEHCNTSRRRSEAFILRHEDGRMVQVGRQCLRDFLGHDSPEHIASLATCEADFHASAGGEEGGFLFGPGPFTPETVKYLAWVAWTIDRWGWLSRKNADIGLGRAPTSATAAHAMEKYVDAVKGGRGDRTAKPTAREHERAAEILAWVRSLGEDGRRLSDYEHNLKATCGLSHVGDKHFGLVASAVPAFDRAVAARRAIKQEYVGAVGERLRDVRVFVDRTYALDDDTYGRSIVTMRDLEGHIFKWVTNAVPDTGREYAMTATVKKHSIYRDDHQTVVTRAELQADDEPTPGEKSVAEYLGSVIYEVMRDLRRLGWEGEKPFHPRRHDALESTNIPELEAILLEMRGVALAIEPKDETLTEADCRLASRAIVSIIDRALKKGPAPKVKPADKARMEVLRSQIQQATNSLTRWPFQGGLLYHFTTLATNAPDVATLLSLRADLLAYAPSIGLCNEHPERDAEVSKVLAEVSALLTADVSVPQGANPAAAQRAHKRLTKALRCLTMAPFQWEGADAFRARADEALDRSDAVALAAMVDELDGVIHTLVSRTGYETAANHWREEAFKALGRAWTPQVATA